MHRLQHRFLRSRAAACLVVASILVASSSSAKAAEPARATAVPGALTAGDFIRAFAETLDEKGGSIATFEEARAFLARRGVSLPQGLDASEPLTEGLIAQVANRAGVASFTEHPERRVGQSEADAFLSSVAASGNAGADAAAGNSTDGQIVALGACCVSGSCTLSGPSYCAVVGGLFRGSGVSCSPDPCAAGVGTCCLGRLGPCTFTQPNECDGRFRGTQVCTRKTCSRETESPTQP